MIDALRRGTVPQQGLDITAVGLGRFEAAIQRCGQDPKAVVEFEVDHLARDRGVQVRSAR
ncbi:DUF2791 family P-loop domain-containing protein [Micromonospora sp. C72]|nr:DUF2791 family P-loop domain-containing protein [Micromonospora sp. C72]